MGTACTMQMMTEALGLSLPGSALVPAASPLLADYARRAGEQAVALTRAGIRTGDIVTKEAFENAVLIHAAISGSTNAMLHLPAIAHEYGIELDCDMFDRMHRGARWLLDVRPAEFFTSRGFRDQHSGGQAFAHEESVMGWLFGEH